MKIKPYKILFAILVALLCSSCIKEKLETTYKKQESQIDSYLSKNKKGGLDAKLAASTKWIALAWVILTLALSLV